MKLIYKLASILILFFTSPSFALTQDFLSERVVPLLKDIRNQNDISERLQLLIVFQEQIFEQVESKGAQILDQMGPEEDLSKIDSVLDEEHSSMVELSTNLDFIVEELKLPITYKKCRDAKSSLADGVQLTVQQISHRKAWVEVLVAYDLVNAVCTGIDQ